MLRALGGRLASRLQRWIPEPFVFALILTVIVAALALALTESSAGKVIDDWYRGFWILLEFGMQMALMLTTGFAIALSPPVARLIDRLAHLARTPGAVYVLVMIVGGLFGLVSWGWGVLTAVFARELARRVDGIDYAYLVACVYLSGQTWTGGLSSSIPLLLNTEGNFLIETGVLDGTIAIGQTLGSLLNGCYVALYFLCLPVLMWLMRPHEATSRTMAELAEASHADSGLSVAEEAATRNLTGRTVSDRLNNSVLLQFLIAAGAAWYVVRRFTDRGFDLDLNVMIFVFIAIGLVVHVTPMRYVVAMRRSCANISGIIYQYPFYAGIMGIMMFTGLGSLISNWLASNATIGTFPLIAQFSGAMMNLAIPSAGGEWAVIGPALTETARDLASGLPTAEIDAYVARIAMAVAYGETSTNLLQPFFLLIVLPVMGAGVRIEARDLMGYLVVPFVFIYGTTALLLGLVPT